MSEENEEKKEWPKPSLTADVVVAALGERGLRVLFIQRARDPFAGSWALPGGFCEPGETVAESAARELCEETSLTGVRVEEIGCFSRPGRDPRGWVVSIAHLAVVPVDRLADAKAGDDAAAAAWLDVIVSDAGFTLLHEGREVTRLAFDHREILAAALRRFAERARDLVFALLPPRFTLDEARRAWAAIHGPGVAFDPALCEEAGDGRLTRAT